MAIFIDKNTRVLVQGITGHQGTFHSKAMMDFGTNIVAGVTPGKNGVVVNGVKVYNDVKTAVDETGANASVVFVPAQFTKDAVLEAINAGIKLIVVVTEHVPSHDMVELLLYAKRNGVTVIGPNCPGIASPGVGKLGITPNSVLKPGKIGVVSRSGTLTYEIVNYITENGMGESTVLGIGGDKVPGTTFTDVLGMFEKDKDTSAIVMVGEIGGSAEEEAAEFIKKNVSKPVFAYIAGVYAPPGKRMGHAGAIISGEAGTAESKISAFKKAGVSVAALPSEIPVLLKNLYKT
ncbi:MAG: succinate--CoA ligase subunit alpha [Candidatus Parvarchaeota archaeon]|nr:succinate--CoA ligase subunit alpha [Candidatus Parvarchaeota archaeon]MCL5101524.1 succinate--CoA ligase subunit alpha [Candidatus Parvarchaeota archaeon]